MEGRKSGRGEGKGLNTVGSGRVEAGAEPGVTAGV